MSRKHNTKHDRKRSNYPKRLAKRGLSKAPVMSDLDTMRKHGMSGKRKHTMEYEAELRDWDFALKADRNTV